MQSVRLRLGGAVSCVLLLMGCNTSGSGERLNVISTLSSTTCGAAVEVEESEEFEVRITRSNDELTWYEVDTGDTIQGSISDGVLTLAEVEVYQVTLAGGADSGCAVRRHDSYTGTLTIANNAITKMECDVVSNYAEADGYTCDALIGQSGGFSDLPCEIKYSLVGTPKK